MKKFDAVSVPVATPNVWGENGTTPAQECAELEKYPVLTIDLKGATNAGVATIMFDRGNGFNNPVTQNAGKAESYYEPGVTDIQITIAGEETSVVIVAGNPDYRT